MSKQEKIISVLAVLVILLAGYLLFNTKQVVNKKTDNPVKVSVDMKKMEEDYQNESKLIFTDYLKLTEQNEITESQIKNDKDKLLALRVPAKFKDLHVNLVFAMDKMENFVKSGDAKEKASSQDMISLIKANYSWLN